MKLEKIRIDKSLNKAYFKQNLKSKDIDLFKKELVKVYSHFDNKQDEEYHKNIISDFFKTVYYKDRYIVNVNKNQDLVIKLGNEINDKVGVIIEFKKPSEKRDMISVENPNKKAFHQLIFYYLRERIDNNNTSIKHLIATNFNEWFIFDEVWFEKNIYENTKLKKEYFEYKLSGHGTKFFYEEIAAKFIDNLDCNLPYTYINLKDYVEIVTYLDQIKNKKLINLYKILSPEHLLKLSFPNDYNKIDIGFYNELLYILGLEENKKAGKKLITRIKEKNRKTGSLLENTINFIKTRHKLKMIERLDFFGENEEKQLFSIGLELVITWLNRILFLKLLEGQLVKFNRNKKDLTFLNNNKIKNFDDLDELFFEILAKEVNNRNEYINKKLNHLPYLNSSLFEITKLEIETIQISSLKPELTLPVASFTVLKNKEGKKYKGELNTLEYLFEFLNAYNFSSERKAEIQDDNKTIINAAVLGLIFEKINGYKDGSFYTPSFITTFICRETIRTIVLKKFSKAYKKQFKNLEQIRDFVDYTDREERRKANEIINNLKICDPAVGSGHFLVSALNELIAIKSKLKILNDVNNERIKGIKIENINDELEIIDEEISEYFQYYVNIKGNPLSEIQNIQKTIFFEKKQLIENCIYGVDINPKSVLICRLRLWIELLKNTYYTEESNYKYLEILPNIEINIKTGNSLISKFDTGLDLFERTAIKNNIIQYKFITEEYKKTSDYDKKMNYRNQIKRLKSELEKYAIPRDKHYRKYLKKKNEFGKLLNIPGNNKTIQKQIVKVSAEISELEKKYKENYHSLYANSMEWSIEFPEILSDKGEFKGFDLVIGNPPYFSISKDKHLKEVNENYKTYKQTGDIYILFIERAIQILKKGGILSYITSNKWMRATYGENLRKFLLENTTVDKIIDFDGLKVFDEATVDTSIISLYNKKNENNTIEAVRFDKTFNLKKDSIFDYFDDNKITLSDLSSDSWNLTSEKEKQLKYHIEKVGTRLEDWNINIYRGITTGLNEAFVIDTETKNKLIKEDKKNKKLIKPLLRGRDIKKYYIEWSDLWIISTFSTRNINIEKYKSLKRYLENYKKQLLAKPKEYKGIWSGRKTGNFKWFEIQDNTAYYPEFSKEKIVFTKASKIKSFSYDNKGYYLLNTSYFLTGEHLKYLLTLLNSKFFNFIFMRFYQSGGIEGEITVQALKKIPIPKKNNKNKNIVEEIEKLGAEIIVNNCKSKEYNNLQARIDELVYNLYELKDLQNGNNNIEAVRFDKTFNLKKDSISKYFDDNKIKLSGLTKSSWNLTSEKENSIKNRITKIGKPLKDWNIKIFRGITTGLNEAFVIDTETKNKLIKEDRKNKKLIKPLLRGRDIKKYYAVFSGLWLLYIPWHFPLHNNSKIIGNSEIADKEFRKKYPSVYKLLNEKKQKLIKRNSSETGVRYEWYALQRSAATYYHEFKKEKIIFTKASQEKSFSYDNKGYFLQNTSYLLTGKNLKYLLALLNSKLINFAFMRFFQSGGIEGEITVQAVKKFPIPEITEDNQETVNRIENLVKKIIRAKGRNKNVNITKQQTEIDKLVYKLYELSREEIKIIEK